MLLNIAAGLIISLDSQGDITLLNESGHRMLGYESPELIGKNWFETFTPVEGREEIWNYFKSLQDGRSDLTLTKENDVITKSGERRTILWHNSVIRDKDGKNIGLLSSGEDISERKQAEELLRLDKERFNLAIKNTGAGIWDWDMINDEVVYSTQWKSMLGYADHEVKNSFVGWKNLWHPDDAMQIEKAIDDYITGKMKTYEVIHRCLHKDGGWRWILTRGDILKDEEGRSIRWVGTNLDITNLKNSEEKISILLAEKELLLKEVHHRIKNNMNTVSGLLSLQAKSMTEPAAIMALTDARNRIQSMSVLYDKLYMAPDYTQLSIKNYLISLIDEIIKNFPNSQMVKLEKDIQDFVLDAKRLQTLGIIINELLTNIMKYAFRGIDRGQITFSVYNNQGHITISVQDDGNGIPESVSLENSKGFGLQLVNALAQQLDGTIWIERDAGTKVVLEFKI